MRAFTSSLSRDITENKAATDIQNILQDHRRDETNSFVTTFAPACAYNIELATDISYILISETLFSQLVDV